MLAKYDTSLHESACASAVTTTSPTGTPGKRWSLMVSSRDPALGVPAPVFHFSSNDHVSWVLRMWLLANVSAVCLAREVNCPWVKDLVAEGTRAKMREPRRGKTRT